MPPKSSEKLWKKALEAYDRADWDSAIKLLTEVISMEPNRAEAYCLRGDAYARGYDRALADYYLMSGLDLLRGIPGYVCCGGLCDQQYDYGCALADYDRAVELKPKDALNYARRGDARAKEGDYDRALADYGRVAELEPKAAWGYLGRGRLYERRGDHESALADYGRVVELEPKAVWGYLYRGGFHERRGDHESALADYGRVAELEPKAAWGYFRRGKAYTKQGNYARAVADYEKALEYDADGILVRHFPFVAFFIQFSKGMAQEKRAEIFSLLDLLRKAALLLKWKAFESPRKRFAAVARYTLAAAASSLVKKDSQRRLYNAANMSDPEEGWTLFDMLKGGDYRKEFYGDDGGGMEYSPTYIGSFFLDEEKESGKKPGVGDTFLFWRLYGKEQEREAAGCSLSYSASLFAAGLSADTVFCTEPLELLAVFYYIDLAKEIRSQIDQVKIALDKILDFRKETDAKYASLINACTRGFLDEVRFLFKPRHYVRGKEVRLIKVHYRPPQGDSSIKEDSEAGDASPRLYLELSAALRLQIMVLWPCASAPDDAQANYFKCRDEAITVVRSNIRYR